MQVAEAEKRKEGRTVGKSLDTVGSDRMKSKTRELEKVCKEKIVV